MAPFSSSVTNNPNSATPLMWAEKQRADRIANESRAVALDRGALGRGGTPLSRRNMLADRAHLAVIDFGWQGAGAEISSRSVGAGDQRAMDEQIGIAPDRRGEMGVAPKPQPEMADIGRAVGGLRLAAQHELVDERRHRTRLCPPQQSVEQLRLWRLTLGKREAGDTELLEEIAQRRDLFRVGRVVDPVHAGLAARLEFLGGGDIGKDHEFLDQPVAVEPQGRDDRDRPPFGVEHDPILAKVEFERAPRDASLGEGVERAIKRCHELRRSAADSAFATPIAKLPGFPHRSDVPPSA